MTSTLQNIFPSLSLQNLYEIAMAGIVIPICQMGKLRHTKSSYQGLESRLNIVNHIQHEWKSWLVGFAEACLSEE